MNGADRVRRLGLGADLRQLRKDAGLSTRAVAERLDVSRMVINRSECGLRNTPQDEMVELCNLYGVTGDERKRLIERASGGDGSNSWLATGPAMADQVMSLVELENEASQITDVALGLIPGLLQTREYMRGVLVTSRAPDWMEHTRSARQNILTSTDAPKFRFIIEESVLRRPIGGVQVFGEQLIHLMRMGAKPNISIQVVPLNAGRNAALDGSFVILDFPQRDSYAYVEARGSGLILTRPKDVEPFEEARTLLDKSVLDEYWSMSLMIEIWKELPNE